MLFPHTTHLLGLMRFHIRGKGSVVYFYYFKPGSSALQWVFTLKVFAHIDLFASNRREQNDCLLTMPTL